MQIAKIVIIKQAVQCNDGESLIECVKIKVNNNNNNTNQTKIPFYIPIVILKCGTLMNHHPLLTGR